MLNNVVAIFDGGGAPVSGTSYESIATVSVGSGGTSTVTFSSIPQNFKQLQVRGIVKLNSGNNLMLRMNSDSGNYYTYDYLFGSGTAASASASSGTEIIGSYLPTATSVFGAFVWDIYEYTNTNKQKNTLLLTGMDTNGGGNVAFYGGSYENAGGYVHTLSFSGYGGTTIQEYSHFALYGVKS